MKVFQINVVYGVGSTGRIVVQLKHMLESQEDECFVAYGRGKTKEHNTYRIGNTFDLYNHALFARLTDRAGFYSKYSTKKLIRIIKELNPDIIHLHNLHGYYLNIEVLFAFLKEYNKPVVWTMHDCWAYTGHCAHYSVQKCEKWMEQCGHCPQLRSYPSSILIDNSVQNFRKKKRLFCDINNITIITPSYWLRNEIKKSFLKEYDVRCIYNGIDLNIFKPTHGDFRIKYRLENKKVVLGVAGIWSARKGLSDFIALAKEISEDYTIVMVGLSSKQAKEMPDNVFCIEKTNSVERLAELYTMADVYFNASIEETMGMTTIEALACGTPVVVYNRTAVPEVVSPEIGVVVEAGNIGQVKSAINNIISAEIMSKKCREYATRFCKEEKYGEYISLYRELYNGRPNTV